MADALTVTHITLYTSKAPVSHTTGTLFLAQLGRRLEQFSRPKIHPRHYRDLSKWKSFSGFMENKKKFSLSMNTIFGEKLCTKKDKNDKIVELQNPKI